MGNYVKEILCLLVIKAILLTMVWYFCFRNPLQLDDKAAGGHILGISISKPDNHNIEGEK